MKTKATVRNVAYASLFASVAVIACQKESVQDSTTSETSTSSTIAVASSASVAVVDSVYLMQPCDRGSGRDSIAASSLPAAVTSYISANYAGSVFHKAFAIKSSSGSVTGYVAVVYFNDKPVGLQFDASGNFVKVLEQRDEEELHSEGGHHGRHFPHRDGRQKDTIAISSLPSSIQAYLAANYSSDTLVKAFINADSSYVVLSKNSGLFATVFDASGSFVKRTALPAKEGAIQAVEASALVPAITTYLSATYPNYEFKKAFAVTKSSGIAGYVVFLNANNTKYAVAFDASGNFLKAKTIY